MAHVYVVMDSEDGLQGAFTSVSKAYAIAAGAIQRRPRDLEGNPVKLDDVKAYFRQLNYGGFMVYGASEAEILKLELNRWMS